MTYQFAARFTGNAMESAEYLGLTALPGTPSQTYPQLWWMIAPTAAPILRRHWPHQLVEIAGLQHADPSSR
jgi:hypothetical protein